MVKKARYGDWFCDIVLTLSDRITIDEYIQKFCKQGTKIDEKINKNSPNLTFRQKAIALTN